MYVSRYTITVKRIYALLAYRKAFLPIVLQEPLEVLFVIRQPRDHAEYVLVCQRKMFVMGNLKFSFRLQQNRVCLRFCECDVSQHQSWNEKFAELCGMSTPPSASTSSTSSFY